MENQFLESDKPFIKRIQLDSELSPLEVNRFMTIYFRLTLCKEMARDLYCLEDLSIEETLMIYDRIYPNSENLGKEIK